MGGSKSASRNKRPESRRRNFWDFTGQALPAFFGAPSTQYYFECERRLFVRYFPGLAGKRLLKTDLWDEAKNTRILIWAAEQKSKVFGIDISPAIAGEAKAMFLREKEAGGMIISDVRRIAFKEESFDYLYSMGTIEHFPEHAQAVEECFRVLHRGGIAMFGVPNKYDPFLRPLLVALLNRLGLYAYGFEKSFSFRKLEKLLANAGFKVETRTGILFVPGLLRMADLYVYTRYPRASFLFKPLFDFFSFLYKKFVFLHRHGYLIACVAKKPA
ncbi:MAG: class I SAM-dependent methyltransferase [Clostridiales bacterium]|nr:class I SAM-dependent methyltransferase [Clostridiales bacterium]